MAKEKRFSIEELLEILREMLSLVQSAKETTPQNQWIVIFEINQMIYNLIVLNTCIDLFAWNKLSSYYEYISFTPEDWLNLQKGYLEAFIQNCEIECKGDDTK